MAKSSASPRNIPIPIPIEPNSPRRRLQALGNVLIVDDDPVLVEALADLLEQEGYRVEAHTDARGGLERLAQPPRPSAVLLDYLMPTMNGDEFLAALAERGIDVPIILFTAMTEPRLAQGKEQVARIIKKPFDLDDLLDTLKELSLGQRS